MARKLRVQYPGAICHVMNRGDRREAIFRDEKDRTLFMDTLAEACKKTGWHNHAWCLMPNHFHLVVETPSGNLVAGMKWLMGTYTGRFNRRHKNFGHLFSGRYKALIIDGSGNGYLKTGCDYVHLNPARAKMLSPEQKLQSYAWSSFGSYLKPRRKRPTWLRVDRLLGEHGIPMDTDSGRLEFERRMELRRESELDDVEFKLVKRGWCLGGKRFKKDLLAQMKKQIGQEHYSEERQQIEEEQAEAVVQDGLKRLGWKESDLSARPKGDKRKLKLAIRLRAETAVTTKWISQRLQMGTWTYLNHLLYWNRREIQE